MNSRFEQLKLGLPLRWAKIMLSRYMVLHLRFSSRQSRSQTPNSTTQTPSSSTPQSDHSSTTNFIYKTLLNSPRMFRKAMTMTPSTDESPMSVRSESPYGKKHGLKLDSGLGRLKGSGDSGVTMSAPNTPGSKRALMPRYLSNLQAGFEDLTLCMSGVHAASRFSTRAPRPRV